MRGTRLTRNSTPARRVKRHAKRDCLTRRPRCARRYAAHERQPLTRRTDLHPLPPPDGEVVGLDPVAEDDAVDLTRDPEHAAGASSPAVSDAPVAGLSHASRTNHASSGAAGAGRSRRRAG